MLFSIKKKQEQFIKKKTRLGRRRTSAVARVATNLLTPKINIIMATISIKIKSVAMFTNNGSVSVRFTTDKSFKGFAQSVDTATGEVSFVESDVNHFSLTMPQLVRAANLVMPLHAFYFSGLDTREISQEAIRNLFVGCTMVLDRELVPAGTEYETSDGNKAVTKRDAYRTDITGVTTCELNDAQILGTPITKEMILKAIM